MAALSDVLFSLCILMTAFGAVALAIYVAKKY